MYTDPNRIRRRDARIRLDAYESALIDALVAYTGMERAALLRHMIMREAVEMVGIDENSIIAERRARDSAPAA